MPRGRKQIVPHRRRRETKTDYRKRFALLKSGKPRFVIRKSINRMTCQIVEYQPTGDKTLVSVNSSELSKFGWTAGAGNIPAAYLTGLLCGVRAKTVKVKVAVADSGIFKSTKGNRIYAALKGFADAGISVSHSADILPDENRIKGSHIASYAERLKKESPDEYKKRFSSYLKSKTVPENLPVQFDKVKAGILKSG